MPDSPENKTRDAVISALKGYVPDDVALEIDALAAGLRNVVEVFA